MSTEDRSSPPHDHVHDGSGLANRLRALISHNHSHDPPIADTGAAGVRASKFSLAGLGLTAILQAIVVAFTGSVALLADTIHNLTDALTAVPLWIAFALGRRARSNRFTFGLGRAEDMAGLLIVVAIAVSAGGVAWESVTRLSNPRTLDHVGWVIAAGIIGAIGNELVAEYRIRVGRRISSEALIADGHHARADALTSLAVVAAGLGAAVGADWMDPVAGLAVAALIVLLLKNSAIRVFGRLLDAVEPSDVNRVRDATASVDGVETVDEIRMRWHGHRLLITITAAVDSTLSVGEGHRISQEIVHSVIHEFPCKVEAVVHIDPAGLDDAHALTEHHR